MADDIFSSIDQPLSNYKGMASTASAPDAANSTFDTFDQPLSAYKDLKIPEPKKAAPQRSLGGHALHAAEVGATGLAKGALSVTPYGLLTNLPTLGAQVGSVLGMPVAAGINAAFGDQNPWNSAAMQARGVQEDIGRASQYIPTPSNIMDYVGGDYVPKPENKLENYVDTAAQFVGGAKKLGQKAIPAAVGGLASEAAGQATGGTPYEPLARIAAGASPYIATRPIAQPKITGPNAFKAGEEFSISPSEAKKIVGDINKNASNPEALVPTLTEALGKNQGEIVPGAKPTMGELSNDAGLVQYQNAVTTNTPVPFQAAEQARNTGMAKVFEDAKTAGTPDNLGSFAAEQLAKMDEPFAEQEAKLNKSAEVARQQSKQQMAEVGRYGEQPAENAKGDTILDAQAVRAQEAGDMYKLLDSVNDSPADHVTVRNKASEILQDAQRAGQRELGSEPKKLIEDILNPNKPRKDTVEELRGYMSQAKEISRERDISNTDRARMRTLVESMHEAVKNTVDGLALKDQTFYDKLLAEKERINGEAAKGRNAKIVVRGAEQTPGTVLLSDAGTEIPSPQRPGSAARGQRVPKNEATFGQRESDILDAANIKYREHMSLSELEKAGHVNPDGTINVGKFSRWLEKPENKKKVISLGDFGKKILDAKTTAEKAQHFEDALDHLRLERANQAKANAKTAFGQLAGENADAVKVVGKIFNNNTLSAAKEFKNLVDKVKSSPDALSDLRAAVAEHLAEKIAKASMTDLPGNQRVGSVSRPDAFQKFFTLHEAALKEVFGDSEHFNNFKNVALEIQRNQNFHRLANLKNKSNTAKDFIAARNATGSTIYGKILDAGSHLGSMLGGILGHEAGGLTGMAAGMAIGPFVNFLKKAHAAGIENRQAFEIHMLTNPEFGKVMLERFSGKEPSAMAIKKATKEVMRLVPAASVSSDLNKDKK